MENKDLRIVFMGTPVFAVESLKALLSSGKNVICVITAPDKPAGRGKKIQSSPVKDFACSHHIPVLQPANLKDPDFISSLTSYHPDMSVVVAFRMLPALVWALPPMGTFNLHASLLPDYRGAAPVNWAVINGEKETGVTTFLIDHEIDTGKILLQEKTHIDDKETAGDLHDRLMVMGAKVVVKTVDMLASGKVEPVPQASFQTGKVIKPAPKIFKENCRINWEEPVEQVYNFIRGLSPYPAAFTELFSNAEKHQVKIYNACKIKIKHHVHPGTIETDGKSVLRIAARGGYIDVKSLQLAGKKKLLIDEFLRGFLHIESFRAM
ncbi:MAG: methionyl-tRNA formyltransferase [Bacteroidales bacterium]